jgi:hypothetical protein
VPGLTPTIRAVGFFCLSSWLTSCSPATVGFPDVSGASPIGLSEGESVALVRRAYSHVGRSAAADPIPERLRNDREPRLVFVTIRQGNLGARVFEGYGRGVGEALENALAKATAEATAPADWLAVEVVERVTTTPIPVGQREETAGLYGVVLQPGNLLVLPQEVIVKRVIDRYGGVQVGRYTDWLAARGLSGSASPAASGRFSTSAAFADESGALPLYRGHAVFDRVGAATLLDAAVAGARYLARAVKHDGRFAYDYWAMSDQERSGYNVLRHAGSVYSMFEVLGRKPDDELRSAAERAIAGLQLFVQPCPPPAAGERCIVEDDIVKLGGNALAVLALAKQAEVTGNREHLPLMRTLARFMVALQRPSGEFDPHVLRASDGAAHPHVSDFYPGEALFALLRLHRLDPGGPWLDAAERGARWLIEGRDADLPSTELPHDHWLLYALNELSRLRPDPALLEHAMAIARAIVRSQNTDPPYPDWRGSFYRPPRSTPAATRIEGLNSALALARDFGSTADATAFRRSLDLATRYLLQQQFRPESALYLPDALRALGGFRRSFGDFEIRIDYVQHAVSALLGYERILRAEAASPPEPEPQPEPEPGANGT